MSFTEEWVDERPISHKKLVDEFYDFEYKSEDKQQSIAPIVRALDIIKVIIESLAGKDKSAKVLKYTLDVINLFVQRTRENIVRWDPQVLTYYKKVLKDLKWWMMLRHPITIAKIWVVAMSRNFEIKASYLSQQLSTYRYILRFGSSPFQVLNIWKKLAQTYKEGLTASCIHKLWFNEDSIREVINLHNTVCDELVLLYKLKVWDHKDFYNWLEKQEAISWEADILFSLKNKLIELQERKQKRYEMLIDLRARRQALELSKSLHRSRENMSPIHNQLLHEFDNSDDWRRTELEISSQLEEYRHGISMIYLDIIRLSCDLIANTTDVLNMRVPRGTYAVFSLGSGLSGLMKLWHTTRMDLEMKNK